MVHTQPQLGSGDVGKLTHTHQNQDILLIIVILIVYKTNKCFKGKCNFRRLLFFQPISNELFIRLSSPMSLSDLVFRNIGRVWMCFFSSVREFGRFVCFAVKCLVSFMLITEIPFSKRALTLHSLCPISVFRH